VESLNYEELFLEYGNPSFAPKLWPWLYDREDLGGRSRLLPQALSIQNLSKFSSRKQVILIRNIEEFNS
jgi:hypothetical protein